MNYQKVSEAPSFSYFQSLVDGIQDPKTYDLELAKIMHRESLKRYEAKDRDGNICIIQNPALMSYQASTSSLGETIIRFKPVVIGIAEKTQGRKVTNF